MDIGSFAEEFRALAGLVESAQQEPSGAPPPHAISRPTPGAIGPKDLLPVTVAAPKSRKDPKEIWQEDELLDVVDDDVDDGRAVPSYEFLYKQAVGTADTFLGMSGKDPSSASCEDLVVRIELPEASSASDLDVDVQNTYLKLSSPHYKLSVHLPHKVDGGKGKAKWDGAKRTLAITVPILREELLY